MNMKPTLLIAADHAGFSLKQTLQKALPQFGWIDLGPESSARVDYPDFAEKLALRVAQEGKPGVLICGSGIGMSIAANKIHGVRAAVVENTTAARLAREHNNANVLCLGARFLATEYAAEIVQAWLEASFEPQSEGGKRHQDRINKITKLEGKS